MCRFNKINTSKSGVLSEGEFLDFFKYDDIHHHHLSVVGMRGWATFQMWCSIRTSMSIAMWLPRPHNNELVAGCQRGLSKKETSAPVTGELRITFASVLVASVFQLVM